MQKSVLLGIYMLVLISIMAGLYELLEPLRGWLIFGAMAALAMALGYRHQPSGGNP